MTTVSQYISEKTGYAEPVATSVIDCFKDFLALSLRQGEKVTLTGLGTFDVKDVPARLGRNPKTGEPVNVPAKKKPTFKFSGTFKGLIQDHAPMASNDDVPPPPPEDSDEEVVPPPPPEGEPDRVWYVSVKGKSVKKTESEMGDVKPTTLVYGNGYTTWTKISDVSELSYLVA